MTQKKAAHFRKLNKKKLSLFQTFLSTELKKSSIR